MTSPSRAGRRLAALCVTGVLVTSACTGGGSSGAEGPVTISFRGWVPGIERAVDLWNAQRSDIRVDFTRIASADIANMPSQIDTGTAPDIAQLQVHALPDYVIDGRAQDLTEYLGEDEDLYSEAAWAGVVFRERVYAVPQDAAPVALMYRRDIFEEYGIEVPRTWDAYAAAAEELHAANPDVYLAHFSPNEPSFWYGDQIQSGGSWYGIDDDAWTVEMDNAETQPVAERWQYLLENDLIKVEQMWTPQFWANVNNGTIASINYAAWFPVLLEENAPALAGKWAVVPSPSDDGEGPYGELGGSVNIVTRTADHPEEAAEFLRWLNGSPESLEILIRDGGLFPAAVAGFDSPALNEPREFWGGQNIAEPFVESAANPSRTAVEGPAYDLALSALGDEFNRVANGQITFASALSNAAAETREIIESTGLTVR
ncbi:ABC transporter substrate-binding protein [Streptomyces sp. NBRC 109706]|uniref:ABC transporter substrate-binding protein n=1 Tax=Streptomyces sp. NBRC 109706 TaxID=1550035 RepID=UPI000B172688|nr:extracellular solute-binding protein [Streptomyces sp. NBRC 109706]